MLIALICSITGLAMILLFWAVLLVAAITGAGVQHEFAWSRFFENPSFYALVPSGLLMVIGMLQFYLAFRKFNLDLYQKRFEIFKRSRDCISATIGTGASKQVMADFSSAVEESAFLFPEDVFTWLRQVEDEILEIRMLQNRLPLLEPREVVKLESVSDSLTNRRSSINAQFDKHLNFTRTFPLLGL